MCDLGATQGTKLMGRLCNLEIRKGVEGEGNEVGGMWGRIIGFFNFGW